MILLDQVLSYELSMAFIDFVILTMNLSKIEKPCDPNNHN